MIRKFGNTKEKNWLGDSLSPLILNLGLYLLKFIRKLKFDPKNYNPNLTKKVNLVNRLCYNINYGAS